jgi:hypothetical protein
MSNPKEREELGRIFDQVTPTSKHLILAQARGMIVGEQAIREQYGLSPESSPAHSGDTAQPATAKRETVGGKPAA